MIDPMNTSKIQKGIIITPNIKVAQQFVWKLRKHRKIGKQRNTREMEMAVCEIPRFSREKNR